MFAPSSLRLSRHLLTSSLRLRTASIAKSAPTTFLYRHSRAIRFFTITATMSDEALKTTTTPSVEPTVDTAKPKDELPKTSEETTQPIADTIKAAVESAKTTVESALPSAETVQSTVESAKANVAAVLPTTESVQSNVEAAKANVETTLPTTESVKSGAETAKTNVEATLPANDTVKSSVETAKANIETATTSTQTAKANNETPKVAEETAKTGNEPAKTTSDKPGIHNILTQADWEAAMNDKDTLIVIDFFAVWCGPCKVIAPQLVKFAQKYSTVRFFNLDVDDFPALSKELNVRSMPTFILYKGGEKLATVVGANPKALEAAIVANLEQPA